jgi:preprotein translocase subunit SecG
MLGGAMPTSMSGTGIIEKNLDRITIAFASGYAVTALLLMVVYRPTF